MGMAFRRQLPAWGEQSAYPSSKGEAGKPTRPEVGNWMHTVQIFIYPPPGNVIY